MDRKRFFKMTALFASVYFVSYISRINYAAVIQAIVEDTGHLKSTLSLAVTGSFITYGIGQVLSGIIGDKVAPKKLILAGFIVTMCMNLLMPFMPSPSAMTAVWCVNGFAQSLMWPPLVRIVSETFDGSDYKKSMLGVSIGSAAATILIYLGSPLLIQWFGWRSVFFAAAIVVFMEIILWQFAYRPGNAVQKREVKAEESGKTKIHWVYLFQPVMIAVFVSVAMQGALRDGVTTWMPSLISETYDLGASVSILTGVLMPIFSFASYSLATWVYTKILKNPLSSAALFFGIGAGAAFIVYLTIGRTAAISAVFTAFINASMHGVNQMLTTMIPPFFKRYGMVSTATGVINAFSYVGSASSTYLIALITEKAGWKTTVFIWLVLAVLGMVIVFLFARPFRKRFMEPEN
ncbi:MAG: MFS transporter [Lachnospiraceae bacterium]|nr:MFS transporter [Lachnospiraceae bacterium]